MGKRASDGRGGVGGGVRSLQMGRGGSRRSASMTCVSWRVRGRRVSVVGTGGVLGRRVVVVVGGRVCEIGRRGRMGLGCASWTAAQEAAKHRLPCRRRLVPHRYGVHCHLRCETIIESTRCGMGLLFRGIQLSPLFRVPEKAGRCEIGRVRDQIKLKGKNGTG